MICKKTKAEKQLIIDETVAKKKREKALSSVNTVGTMGNGGGIEPEDMDDIVAANEEMTDNTPEARQEVCVVHVIYVGVHGSV